MFLNHTTAFNTFAPLANVQTGALFGAATLVETETGWRRADTLIAGDTVATLDGGFSQIVEATQSIPTAMVRLPAGTLGACTDVLLPADARLGFTPPAAFHDAPIVSVPVQALVGWQGVHQHPTAPTQAVTLTLQHEEMVYAQTGLLVHAGANDSDGFFETLSYGDTRALLTRIEGRMIAPDRAAA